MHFKQDLILQIKPKEIIFFFKNVIDKRFCYKYFDCCMLYMKKQENIERHKKQENKLCI